MQIQADRKGKVIVLSLSGHFDLATHERFRKIFESLFTGNVKYFVCDLKDVVFISSVAIGLLVGANEKARETGGDLRLSGVNKKILKPFEVMRFDKIFKIFDTVDDAVSSFEDDKKQTSTDSYAELEDILKSIGHL